MEFLKNIFTSKKDCKESVQQQEKENTEKELIKFRLAVKGGNDFSISRQDQEKVCAFEAQVLEGVYDTAAKINEILQPKKSITLEGNVDEFNRLRSMQERQKLTVMMQLFAMAYSQTKAEDVIVNIGSGDTVVSLANYRLKLKAHIEAEVDCG